MTESALGWPTSQPPPIGVAPRRSPWILALAVLLVASIAAAVIQTVRVHDRDARIADERAALRAARSLATVLDTYDYRTLDQSFAEVRAASADPFRSQYESAADRLRGLLQQYRASATSVVLTAAIASHHGDTIEVVLFVDQTVTNSNTPTPRVDRNRLQLTLRKVRGRFLVTEAQVE